MRHPFQPCATQYCCFCISFSPQVTCYIIAYFCITVNAFSGFTNFGIDHWSLCFISILNFLLHLLAGVLLFLGTIWGRPGLKIAYCWLLLLGIVTVVIGIVLYCVFHKESYVIWDATSRTAGWIMVCLHTVWLILWDIYTPMIVLGNLCDEEETCCTPA